MAIVYFSGRKIKGLSTDTKPTAPEADSKFYETNTKKTFDWNGSSWVERFDATAITANTAKTGISGAQASAITANTAKISLDDNSVTLAKLAHGTAGKFVGFNSSTGVPEEQDAPASGASPFGNGADSDLSTLPSTLGTGTNSSSVTTLTGGTMTKTGYFKELIINAGNTVTVQKQSNNRPTIIYAKTSITINGTLSANGKGAAGGATQSGGSGGTRGGRTSGSSGGGNGGTGSAGNIGTAGHFFNGKGSTGNSSAGSSGGTGGSSGGNCGSSFSGSGGSGGSGTTTDVSGASKITTEEFDDFLNVNYALNNKTYIFGTGGTSGSGGGGGGGKGGVSNSFHNPQAGLCNSYYGSAGGTGGDGGAGGAGGGMIILIAPTIIFGASGKIECNGSDGVTGTDASGGGSNQIIRAGGQTAYQGDASGAGGNGVGGSGGNGGFVMMFYQTLTNLGSATNRTDSFGVQNDYTVYANIEVDKGAAGAQGGLAGNADGRVILHQL
jgi:hypothetical protein